MKKKLIISFFEEDDIKKLINEIILQIEEKNLLIIFDKTNGKSTRLLIEKLRQFNIPNANIEERDNAVLELIYKLRCNMFHGQKEYEDYQKKLLSSTSNILKKLIDILLSELKKDFDILENRL